MSWRIPLIIYAPAARKGGALSILCDVLYWLKANKRKAIVIIHPLAQGKLPTSPLFDIHVLPQASRLARIRADFIDAPRLIRSLCPDGGRVICLSNRALRLDRKYTQHVFVHNLFAIARKIPEGVRATRSVLFYCYIYPILLGQNYKKEFFYHVQRNKLKAVFRQSYRNASRVSVIPPKVPSEFAQALAEARKTIDKREPFFFCPLSANPHKNLSILAKAAPSVAACKLKMIVTVSPQDWVALTGQEVPEGVECIGYVSVSQVARLYLSARATIFPSLLETAGLPLLEAQKADCPVIASDLDFTHDLLGSYAKLTTFDPLNADSLIHALSAFCTAHETV